MTRYNGESALAKSFLGFPRDRGEEMSEKSEALAQRLDDNRPQNFYNEDYEPDLSWMEKRGEWGMRAKPGKRGLTWTTLRPDHMLRSQP